MRAVVQRVLEASVEVGGREVARIGQGMLILLGVERGDTEDDARRLARKAGGLRIFSDGSGRLADPVGDRGILCVSQFTLLGDPHRGRRPTFERAAPAEEARPLYELVCEELGAERGSFGEDMSIRATLDGPVTILIGG